jgi:hypothetical protein
MSIFTSKKVLKLLIKIKLTKSYPKRARGGKCPPTCQLGLKDGYRDFIYSINLITMLTHLEASPPVDLHWFFEISILAFISN